MENTNTNQEWSNALKFIYSIIDSPLKYLSLGQGIEVNGFVCNDVAIMFTTHDNAHVIS